MDSGAMISARPSTTNTTCGPSACVTPELWFHGTHISGFSVHLRRARPCSPPALQTPRASERAWRPVRCPTKLAQLRRRGGGHHSEPHILREAADHGSVSAADPLDSRSAAPRKLAAWDQVSDTSDGASRLRAARVRTIC